MTAVRSMLERLGLRRESTRDVAAPLEEPFRASLSIALGRAPVPAKFFTLQTGRGNLLAAGGRHVTMLEPPHPGAGLDTASTSPLVAIIPDANPRVIFLMAPDLRPIEMRGDGLNAAALSGFIVPNVKPPGIRVRHPLSFMRFMGVSAPGVGSPEGFVFFDGAGGAPLDVFTLLPSDPVTHAPAFIAAVLELCAACTWPMHASLVLERLEQGALRAALIEAVLRIMPPDELRDLGRRLLDDPHLMQRLGSLLPGNRWFATILPQLAAWERHRLPVPGHLMTSPVSDEFAGDPLEGYGLPQAGFALTSLARSTIHPRHGACLLACARNEGAYLIEWLAYHFAAGFEHAFIYTNNNSDGSTQLLEALAAAGAITLIHNEPTPHYGPQYKAHAHALSLLPQILDYRWCAVLDIDEYFAFDSTLFPKAIDILAWQETQPTDAIALCWQIFAGSRTDSWRDEPAIARFLMRERETNAHVKSIFKPHLCWHSHAHYPYATLGQALLFRNEAGAIHHHPGVRDRYPAYAETPSARTAWVNHYMLRSAPEALWKLARGQGDWKGEVAANEAALALFISRSYVNLADKSDLVEDRRILGCAAGMETMRQKLRALPRVAGFEDAIKASFKVKLDRLTDAFIGNLRPGGPPEVAAFQKLLAEARK